MIRSFARVLVHKNASCLALYDVLIPCRCFVIVRIRVHTLIHMHILRRVYMSKYLVSVCIPYNVLKRKFFAYIYIVYAIHSR